MSINSQKPLELDQAVLASQVRIDSQPVLLLRLFGAPNIELVGGHLDISRRQVRALLYRLAIRFEGVSRQHLAFLFWPDAPDTRANRNLSHLLTHLRNALPEPDLLLATEDQVRLDAQRAWSDSAAFEDLCTEGAALRQAVDLYRGPLLADFSLPGCAEFEDWLLVEQRKFEQLYLTALETLVNGWESVGDYSQAIDYARRYLRVDDLAEAMHRRLIIFYAQVGDRTAALRQFEICTTALERDLGVGPLSETRAAYQAVLDGKLPLPQSKILTPKRPSLPSLKTPLVGREGALASLGQFFAETRAGGGQIVFLSGEAGIGKSRLVRDFVAQLGSQAIVLATSAYPAISKPPYQPLVEALRTALGFETPTQLLSHCSPVWLAEVARLLPELRDLCQDLPAPLPGEPDEARTRLFEALSQVIQSLTVTGRPVLVALDNLQWADSATLEWLAYFSQRIHNHPIMFLGTFRPEDAEAVSRLRSSLQPSGILSQIMLTGLSPASVLQVLHHFISPTPGDESLAGRLHQATGGNPFFLLETLCALSEAGQLQVNPRILEDFPLPEGVRNALDARLSVLTASARQVLESAAVLGLRFRFDWVRLTSGRSEPETINALEELVARQLLVEDGMEYQFVHDLVCRAVKAGLSPIRRVLLHRRAARSLERLTPTAVGSLAYHFDAGGETEKALHYYDLAAQGAEASFAWQEAEEYYSHVLELLAHVDPLCARQDCLERHGRVLETRAHLRYLQGRLTERNSDLSALAALAETTANESLRLKASIQQARYLNLDGQYTRAIAIAEQGLTLAVRLSDDVGRCGCLTQIGFAYYFRGEYVAAIESLQTALLLKTTDQGASGEVLSVLSYTYYLIADYERSLEYRGQALTARSVLGQRARVAEDLTDMGILHTRLNRLPEAEQYLRDALTLAREIGSQVAESYALNNLGNLHYLRGDYSAALECYTDSLVLQRLTGSRRGESSSLGNMGMTVLALGDYAAAESLQRQSIAIDEEIGYQSGLAEGLAHLARALAGQGQYKEALGSAKRGLEIAERIGDRSGHATALNVLAWLYLRVGDVSACLDYTGRALSLTGQSQLIHGRIFTLMLMGLAFLNKGDPAQALNCTTQAVDLLRAQGLIEGAEEAVYLAHYQVLKVLGQAEDAKLALDQAQAEIAAKAERIVNPEQRSRYLTSWPLDTIPRL